MDDIDFIPTGTSGDSVPAFTYETPFDSSSTSALSSTFPDELGDINSPGTKIFNAYTEVSETKIKINSIAESADTFSGSISTFQSAVGGVRDTINTFADLL